MPDIHSESPPSSLNTTPALYFLITILLRTPVLPGVLHARPGWHFSVIFTLSVWEGASSSAAGSGSRGQLALQCQSLRMLPEKKLAWSCMLNTDTYMIQILDARVEKMPQWTALILHNSKASDG